MLYKLIRPILFLFDAETAHHITLSLMNCLNKTGLSFLYRKKIAADPVTLMGITFPNRIGLAAGLDKNGDYIDALSAYGFGFIEIGTITPEPQAGNPRPRLFRLLRSKAIINRMGFNNRGVDALVANIKKRKSKIILGVNIGKNAKTPLENAAQDYLICLRKVYPYADYITANISSPNTQNLRDLQSGDALTDLLKTLKDEQAMLHRQYQRYVPLVIKVSPDLTLEQIVALSQAFLTYKIDGIIATNTTLSRDDCVSEKEINEQGGLSGKPLFDKSNVVINEFKKQLQDNIPIVGVGGIMSGADVQIKLNHGADLVQVYSGLVYGF